MDGKKVLYLFIFVLFIIGAMFAFNYFMANKDVSDELVDELPQEDVIAIDNVLVPDQAASDEIYVEKALLRSDEAGGYVTVFRTDESGMPTGMIGVSSYLEPGISDNFLVPLDEGETVEVGDTLVAMLYGDDGDGVWSEDLDTVLMDENGQIVMTSFTILAEEDIPGFETKL
jgi:hypothetical protein